MNKYQLTLLGVICLVIFLLCAFIAVERYQANLANVQALKQMQQNSPMGNQMGLQNIEPTMPAASQYAIFFAILSGVGGVACFVLREQNDSQNLHHE